VKIRVLAAQIVAGAQQRRRVDTSRVGVDARSGR
jgi:hypothetical protein